MCSYVWLGPIEWAKSSNPPFFLIGVNGISSPSVVWEKVKIHVGYRRFGKVCQGDPCHDFGSKYRAIWVENNNAGVLATHYSFSEDNIEMQFATNHLGHFLLINLLLGTMKSTAQKHKVEGRIVIVSSIAHRASYREGIRFAKINDKSGYNTVYAYGQSKLANILHANELSLIKSIGKYFMKDVQQGAATTCYVALHPQVKGVSGEYFADSNSIKPSELSQDTELAKKLWEFSVGLVD
ncbi:NADP-retinol dehydrogenase [Ranunculus cassubicifolius]